MKRKVVSLLIISLPLLLAAVILQFPVTAAPVQQTVPTPVPAEGTSEAGVAPLPQPQQIVIHQQIPLTFTVMVSSPITNATTTTDTTNLLGAFINSLARPSTLSPTLSVQTIGVTLTLDLQLTVTDTLTTTVPSTVTLKLANQPSTTLPVSLTIGALPTAQVVITLLPPTAPITVEAPITTTVDLTPTVPVSPTAGAGVTATGTITTPIISGAAAITGSVVITANLRSGPDTTFDAVGTATGGQIVTVVAQNEDGTWYLLNNGVWISASLVENIQGGLPLATDALVTTLRDQAAITPTVAVTTTPTITTTAAVTATEPVTESTAVTVIATPTATGSILVPTPTPATQPVQPPSVTVNANLRSGPGPTFPIIGGTVTGQVITIVARNEDASWFQLDNGGWVSATLVANPPATVPLFGASQPTATLAATATPIPTPATPPTVTTTTTTTTTARALGVQENVYVIRVDGIVDGYDFSLTKIDELITRASTNEALLKDQAWIVEMTTAITLLRSNSEEVNSLTPPPLFVAAHATLTQAAATFTTAAGLLEAGITAAQPNIVRLDEALAQITVGTSLLTRAQDAIEAITP